MLAANPKTIVVLQASFPFTTTWTQENVPAILMMTHNSEEQGDGMADVLFGDYNPAGRLSRRGRVHEPAAADDGLRHPQRADLYVSRSKPLYAFGYGLSYTKFAYSNLRVSSAHLAKDGIVTVSVDVKNAGARDGDEVVQLYVAHVGSKVARPLQELKGFRQSDDPRGRDDDRGAPIASERVGLLGRQSDDGGEDSVELRVGGSSDAIALRKQIKSAK